LSNFFDIVKKFLTATIPLEDELMLIITTKRQMKMAIQLIFCQNKYITAILPRHFQ